jgi:hypothetical protein
MTPFEQELKKALARREPAAGFSERLLARIEEERRAAAVPWWRKLLPQSRRMMAWAAPVCAVALLTSGTVLYQEHQRTVQGERARQQLLLALRITSDKLQATERQLHEVESGYRR